jgi:tetratricopeptide (TPR) repeat protein
LALLALGAGAFFYRKPLAPPPQASPMFDLTEVREELVGAELSGGVRALDAACQEPQSCTCVEAVLRGALDLRRPDLFRAVVTKLPDACPIDDYLGLRAEAQALERNFEGARALAGRQIELHPDDPFARQAVALTDFASDDFKEARESAEKALKLGRGAEAHRVLGFLDTLRGDFEKSKEHFEAVATASPRDLEAAFNLAMCSQKLGQYRDTREGLLRVLKLDPKHAQARYWLTLLTLSVGARAEAAHHRSKFLELVDSGDPQVAELERAFAGKPPKPDSEIPAGGAPPMVEKFTQSQPK